MCCRYGYEPGIIVEAGLTEEQILPAVRGCRAGDVHPSDPAVIIRGTPGKPAFFADVMPWGLFSREKKLLINARAETAAEKKMFSDSVLHRRCIIPAKLFYEWDRNRVKNRFSLPDGDALFMAGFYNLSENADRFIILTTEANESVKEVHDRMPLILKKDMIKAWIMDDSCIKNILAEKPPLLERTPEYEQLSFF